MARRYVRDKRGRFASTGATARGARLAKKSGKRATVTEKLKGGKPSGTVGKSGKSKPESKAKDPSRKDQQRQIATQMKKDVRSKNIQATRILQRMAAKDGYGGDVKRLTSQRGMSGNKWTQNNRGNQLAASKSKDLMFDRAPSQALVSAATSAASAGRVSQRRLNTVLQASGSDYMSVNRGYDRAVSRAKSAQSRRRRR